jgi:hypothetical protein
MSPKLENKWNIAKKLVSNKLKTIEIVHEMLLFVKTFLSLLILQ